MKKKTESWKKIDIPYALKQEKIEVELKRWHNVNEQRIDLTFRTENSVVTHSLSLKQFELLKQKIREFA